MAEQFTSPVTGSGNPVLTGLDFTARTPPSEGFERLLDKRLIINV